ncbi:MAG TPA: helix-turn-helix domain-containing protein [Solirubrobacterales bacterium]|nr:helix-turn-helix domain-containing protein [Solirubrobacterales bacterium]
MQLSADSSLRHLHGRLDARRGELEQAALARIVAIPDPSAAPDPAYVNGLRSALAAGLNYGLAAIAAPRGEPGPVPVELLGQARLAARNGVTLDAVLRRYSAGHTLIADGLLEEAAALGLGAAELRTALRALAARYDRIVAAVSDEYEREASAKPGGTERRRYTLLRRLLAGEPLDATSLGYEFNAHHLALVATGASAVEALGTLGGRLDRRLLLTEPDTHLVWAWLGGRHELSRKELDVINTYPWPETCVLACGEPGRGLAAWRLSHRQALAALPIAQKCSDSIVHYADVALLATALQDDLLLTSLRRRYLTPLESKRDRGVLAKQTLRAYFAAAGNVTSAAAALKINRSTLRGRLKAIEALLGRTLDTVHAELELILCLEELE